MIIPRTTTVNIAHLWFKQAGVCSLTALLSLPHGWTLEAVPHLNRRVDSDDRVVGGLTITK